MTALADTVIDIYQKNAAAFARQRSRTLVERAWLDRFADALPPAGREVLDLGCGTGQPIAQYLIRRSCRITGVDGAAAMIDRARGRFPDQRWSVEDMRALPPLGRFDGLIAWHSLFHLTPAAQRPMFATFRRLCRPGAPLMFTSGTELGEAIGTFEGRRLYHGSLSPEEYRQVLRDNGFEVLRHVENDPACGGATVWLARATGN